MQAPERVIISKRTTWERLREQVAERDGTTFTIIGIGERARHLLERLRRETPNVAIHRFNDKEYMAVVGLGEPRAVILPH